MSAGNGREALERLVEEPQLILLDLIMPEMNGWEFLAHKKNSSAADIPVFILSASDPFGLDASEYFQKPIDVDKLLNSIHKYFSRN